MRGSTDHSAGADAEVKMVRSGDRVKLTSRNHAAPDDDLTLRVTFPGNSILIEAATSEQRSDDAALRGAILRICSPGPVSASQLRTAVRAELGSIANERIDAMAEQLEREGLLRHGFGRGAQWMTVLRP